MIESLQINYLALSQILITLGSLEPESGTYSKLSTRGHATFPFYHLTSRSNSDRPRDAGIPATRLNRFGE